MKRGEIWTAQVGRKSRPVLVLTRTGVIDVRALVTVAEITSSSRGIAAEVPLGGEVGLERASVVNCDGIHTVAQSVLTARVGAVDDEMMLRVCDAVAYAIGC